MQTVATPPAAVVTTTTTVPPAAPARVILTDRDTTASSTYQGLPTWARLTFQLGLPSVLVIWFMWAVLGSLSKNVQAMSQSMILHTQQVTEHNEDFRDFIRVHQGEEEQMKAILMQICANGARTSAERSACFPAVTVIVK